MSQKVHGIIRRDGHSALIGKDQVAVLNGRHIGSRIVSEPHSQLSATGTDHRQSRHVLLHASKQLHPSDPGGERDTKRATQMGGSRRFSKLDEHRTAEGGHPTRVIKPPG